MATGNLLSDEAMRLYRAERYEEAAAKFAEAQTAFAASNSAKDVAEAANNRGMAWRQAAHWAEARAAFEEARALFTSIADVAGEGQVAGNLGALAESEGKLDQAARLYAESIDLLESAGDKDSVQMTYVALSRLRMKQGNWFGALNAYENGLAQADRLRPMQRVLLRLIGTRRKLIGR